MYITYEKLWKLLVDKRLTKTDLLSLCGISSRTLSKLSKNENVNSETLLRICEALDCDISDVMEVRRGEEERSLSDTFVADKKLIASDKICSTYEFEYRGKRVLLKKTKKRATKFSVIKCEDRHLVWTQVTMVGRTQVPEDISITYGELLDPDVIGIIVISGKPNHIKGLDEGVYVSGVGTPKGQRFVYVMSEARFKLFSPQIKDQNKI